MRQRSWSFILLHVQGHTIHVGWTKLLFILEPASVSWFWELKGRCRIANKNRRNLKVLNNYTVFSIKMWPVVRTGGKRFETRTSAKWIPSKKYSFYGNGITVQFCAGLWNTGKHLRVTCLCLAKICLVFQLLPCGGVWWLKPSLVLNTGPGTEASRIPPLAKSREFLWNLLKA